MRNKKAYWEHKEQIRAKTGTLPENSFDFISIHNHHDQFRLISPLCICDEKKGIRPEWEHDNFSSLKQANKAAEIIAAIAEKEIGKKIEIVFCPSN